jgi:hypothetical protein
MTPVITVCLLAIIGVCWAIVHYFGFPVLLGAIAVWIAYMVWRKDDERDAP